jgi:hypothetical protein
MASINRTSALHYIFFLVVLSNDIAATFVSASATSDSSIIEPPIDRDNNIEPGEFFVHPERGPTGMKHL